MDKLDIGNNRINSVAINIDSGGGIRKNSNGLHPRLEVPLPLPLPTVSTVLKNDPNSFEKLEFEPTTISKAILTIQVYIHSIINKITAQKVVLSWSVLFLYVAYVTAAVLHYYISNTNSTTTEDSKNIGWCDGLGLLIIITTILVWSLFYYKIITVYAGEQIWKFAFVPIGKTWDILWEKLIFRAAFYGTILAGILTFLILDSTENPRKLLSAFGIPAVLLFGLIISKHPSRVAWRHILWGTALQFLFGIITLRWEFGRGVLQCLSDKATTFLTFVQSGTDFVFGFVANGFQHGEFNQQGSFAFGILSVIYYYGFVISILYHLGALTWVVAKAGWFLQVTIGTTAAESCNAAANIFLGMCEAPLSVKPFLPYLTRSELHAIMTGGFATVAGATMAAYVAMGISPSHLLSASFMSAPAALALSKLIYPETNVSKTTAEKIQESAKSFEKERKSNLLEAASDGATQAVLIISNIIATIIAVISTVAFINALLNWFGILIGFNDFSFQWIATKLFYPFAIILGVDNEEIDDVAYLLGLKTVVNEFVAYERMGKMANLSPRAKSIATYALCCFANFSAIPVQLSTMVALAPERKKDLSNIIWRAFIAGNLAAIMTACIAGTLISEPGYAEWKSMNSNNSLTLALQHSMTENLF